MIAIAAHSLRLILDLILIGILYRLSIYEIKKPMRSQIRFMTVPSWAIVLQNVRKLP